MTHFSESPITVVVGRLVAPFIQLFGLYVIVHGHYGPGGGFQGGAMIAASFLLIRLSAGETASQVYFRKSVGTPLGILGASVFVMTGVVCMLMGGAFLDYHHLPLPGMTPAELRYMGILFVEVGIGVAVAATLVTIFDDLLGGGDVS